MSELKLEHFSVACPALQESYRLDPQAGTLFTLAECEARAGQVASAVAHFDAFIQSVAAASAAEQAKQYARVGAAKARRTELAPAVPQLVIRVPNDIPSDAVVLLDDAPVARVSWNAPLPTDPGAHILKLRLADGRQSESQVALEKSASVSVLLVLPETKPAPPPPPPPITTAPASKAPLPAVVGSPTPRAASQDRRPVRHGRRPWSYLAFGVGAAGLVTGGVAGAVLISKRATISGHCEGRACDESGYASSRNIGTFDTMANIGFGVGLAGAAVGIVLLMTDHGSPPNAAHIRHPLVLQLNGEGANVSGAF
ncbi:MAG TPA: hypothetical protein VHB79_04235 [Polyangiaceae bacterium]|nr:hypothetical protein [Polyangiaceae bacterium]